LSQARRRRRAKTRASKANNGIRPTLHKNKSQF